MRVVNMGYVGCGFMAQKVHLPNFSSLPGCRIMGLAEIRQDLREKVGARFQVPRLYANHLELADDPDIEAIAVSADFSLQNRIAEDLLLRGKTVFMEKPMATSIERAQALLDAQSAGGGRLMVAYMKRYDAGYQLARDTVRAFRASGELGAVTFVRAHGFEGDWLGGLDTPMDGSSEAYPPTTPIVPDWLPEAYVGPYISYLQQFTHNINLARFMLDAGDHAKVRFADLDDDGCTGVVILEIDGIRVSLETGSISHYRWDEHMQVFFRNGWVKADGPALLLRNVPAEVEIYRAGSTQEFSRPIANPAWEWSYKREAQHFIDCVATGAPFASDAQDTVTDVRLFEDIYRIWLTARGLL